MTGLEVYQMYIALKLHFTKENYDYFKFRGKSRVKQESFDKRKDSYFFKKLSAKYEKDRIEQFFVSNLIADDKNYIKNMMSPRGEQIYSQWVSRNNNLINIFRDEISLLLDNIDKPYDKTFDTLFTCTRGKHPIILTSYLRGEISIETISILERCLGFVSGIDGTLTDPIWKTVKNQIIKYAPFLRIDSKTYKSTIIRQITEKG